MKLFLIILVWGQVGVTVGPLPDSMPECVAMATQRVADIDKSFSQRMVFTQKGRLIWRSDIAVGCGHFAERPTGGTPVDQTALTKPE